MSDFDAFFEEGPGVPFDPAREPFDVPIMDVDAFPKKCIDINAEWVPLVLAMLDRLRYGDAWNGTDADKQRAHQNIDHLMSLLALGDCANPTTLAQCQDIPLTSSLLKWEPMNPFSDPDDVPLGWAVSPWEVSGGVPIFEFLQAGDVFTDFSRYPSTFPPFLPISGFPRVTFYVEGDGEVELELIRIPQGGVAQVRVDGVQVHLEPLSTLGLLDLTSAVTWFEIFQEIWSSTLFDAVTVEVPITGPGVHEVVVEMRPALALNTILGFGGGIRQVEFCGVTVPLEYPTVIGDIRINNGTIEKFVDAVWQNVDVADTDDVLTEDDLRGNGCALEYYDMATAGWVKVPGADFYNIINNCDIQHSVIVDLDANGYGFQQRDAGGTIIAQWGLFGTGAYQWGDTGSWMVTDAGSVFGIQSDTRFMVRDPGSNPTNDALLAVRSNANKQAMSVHMSHAGPANIMHWRNSNDVIVAELAQTGWFSAIQQLIVNDLSSTSVKRAQGRILGQWADSTDATRKGRVILQADDYHGVREGIRVESDGDFAMLGFYGSPADYKPIVGGTTPSAALAELLSSLEDLGLIDNISTVSASTPGVGVETRYEQYWDAKDHNLANDWDLLTGNWYITTGYQHAIFLGESVIILHRDLSDLQEVYDWRIKLEIDNLTAGTVLVAVTETSTPNHTIYSQSYGEGIHYITIPIERRFNANHLDLYITTDADETALLVISDIWERGVGMPDQSISQQVTDLVVTSDLPATWDIDED